MRLREYTKEKEVNIAIGEMWMAKLENDLDELLKKAEKLMYEEKADCYS